MEHELGISHTTIVNWYNFTREVWISILENFSEQMGGPGKIVEIVESKFGKENFTEVGSGAIFIIKIVVSDGI